MHTVLLISLLVPIMSFMPGLLFLRTHSSLKNEELIASSFGLSFLFLGLTSFVGFLLGLNQIIFNLAIFLFLMIYFCYRAFKKSISIRDIFLNHNYTFPLFLLLTYYFHLLFLQAIFPVYDFGLWYGDWWMHYDITNIYLSKIDSGLIYKIWFGKDYLFSRTPLFNLVSAYFMSIVGRSFWKFQIISSLLNSCFILSLYIVVKKIFNRNVANFCFFVIFFSPWVTQNALLTWPKLFCSYFILLAFYFCLRFLEKEEYKELQYTVFLIGMFCGLAYLSHQMALFYIISIIIAFLLPGRKRPSIFFISLLLVILPWHIWIMIVFGIKRIFMHYLLINTSGLDIYHQLKTMLLNAVASIVPYDLIKNFYSLNVRTLYLIYNGPLLGAMTVTGSLFISASVIKWFLSSISGKRSFKTIKNKVLTLPVLFSVLFISLGFVGGILGHRGIESGIGILHASAVPSVLLILAYGFALIYFSRWRWFISMGIIFEFILVIWLRAYLLPPGIYRATNDNWMLKTTNSLVFLRDYLGDYWIIFALLAAAIELFVILKSKQRMMGSIG